MLIYIKNNKGMALANVLIIFAVLMVFLPSLFIISTNMQLHNQKDEFEMKATQLAVSGMQTLVKYPITTADKLNYLKNNYYGSTPLPIHLPEGNIINYYQYLVPSSVAKEQVAASTNIVDPTTINGDSTYWVVISAVAGDNNSNKIQDNGEGFFKIKTLVGYLDPRQTTVPTINTPYVGDTFVAGTAEPNSIITLMIGASNTTYSGTADALGNYNITGIPALQANQTLSVTAQLSPKPVSLPATATVESKQTATPTINSPFMDDQTISGTAEAGSTITITIGGVTYTCTADSSGIYSLSGLPPLTQGQQIQVTAELPPKAASSPATAVVGNKGQTGAPTINAPYAGDTNITGTTEPNSTVTVTIDTQVYTGTASSSGNYSIAVSALIQGQQIQVTARAPQKTDSPPATATVTSLGQTATPIINPIPAACNTQIKGTAEPNSVISVTVAGGTPISGTADANGNYSVTVSALRLNQQVQVKAQAQGKTVSLPATTTVLATSTTGIVEIVGSDGTVYQEMQETVSTPNQIIITSGVDKYSTNNRSGINLTAGNGIIIESGVGLTTTSSNASLQLTTTGNDIIAQGVDLTTTGNGNKGQFADISIDSAQDVDLDNSILEAVRNITISAGGNISLKGTSITSQKGTITLVLKSSTGKIYVDGLTVSPNAVAKFASGASASTQVVGTPTSGTVR